MVIHSLDYLMGSWMEVKWDRINSPCRVYNNDWCETLSFFRFCFHTSYTEIHKLSQQLCTSTLFCCGFILHSPPPQIFWSVCMIQDTDTIESNKQGHMNSNQIMKARKIGRNSQRENPLSFLVVKTKGSTWLAGLVPVWLRGTLSVLAVGCTLPKTQVCRASLSARA